jgi:hypothetical protein
MKIMVAFAAATLVAAHAQFVPASAGADAAHFAFAASAATGAASKPATGPATVATTGGVRGKTVDAAGKPVAGADVSVFIIANGKSQTIGKAKTAKDGSFLIEGLAPSADRKLWAVFQVPNGPALIGQVNNLKIEAGKVTDVGTIKIAPATM